MSLLSSGPITSPAALWAQLRSLIHAHPFCGEIIKAAGHKYIRRVPTGNPKRPWRYFYTVTGGKKLGHQEEMLVGAAFRLKDGEHEGHFHVISIDGDNVTIKHDESGTELTVKRSVLADRLKKEHAEAIEAAHSRRKDIHARASKHGSAKQKKRAADTLRDFQDHFGGKEEPKPKKKRKPAKRGSRREHVEVGEHVDGSRADLAKFQIRNTSDLDNLTPQEARKAVNKAAILGEIDADSHRESGGLPGGLEFKQYVYRAVTAKPEDSDEARRNYIGGCDVLAKTLAQCKTASDVDDALNELSYMLGEQVVDKSQPSYADWDDLPEDKRYGSLRLIGGRYYTTRPLAPDEEAAQTVLRAQLSALGKRVRVLVKIDYAKTARGRSRTTAYLDARRAARGLDAAGWENYKPKERSTKSKAERHQRWRRNVSETPQRKSDARTVEKASAQQLAKDFGLKNVQFGNWVADGDAEFHLKQAHNALIDLAAVLGVPEEHISFNGRLSIGFGARGSGAASAHYEADRKILNLTKFAGGGSLAHEWGHFMDNVLYEVHGTDRGTAGDTPFGSDMQGRGLSPDLAQAYRGVMAAMEGEFTRHSAAMGKYWRRDHEMFARAFEAYIQDKIEAGGKQNSYLVDGTTDVYATGKHLKADRSAERAASRTPEMVKMRKDLSAKKEDYYSVVRDRRAGESEEERYNRITAANESYNAAVADFNKRLKELASPGEAQPYPQGEQRKAINQAMDRLISVVREGKHLEKALAAMMSAPIPGWPTSYGLPGLNL